MSVAGLGNFLEILAPATYSDASATGKAIDISDYEGELEIYAQVSHVSGTSPTWSGKIQECADIGLGLATASYDHTGGAAERLITKAGAFAGYTSAELAGQIIHLTSVAGGIETGYYEIAARQSDNTISLVLHPGLTGDATSDVSSPSFADISGETFTQVTTTSTAQAITINANACARYIRYVGTKGGTTPVYVAAVCGFGQQKTSAAGT